jgi:hypothetical protein
MDSVTQIGGVSFILLTAGFTRALARPIARVSRFNALVNQNLLVNQLREVHSSRCKCRPATNQSSAATDVMLFGGHSCEPGRLRKEMDL